MNFTLLQLHSSYLHTQGYYIPDLYIYIKRNIVNQPDVYTYTYVYITRGHIYLGKASENTRKPRLPKPNLNHHHTIVITHHHPYKTKYKNADDGDDEPKPQQQYTHEPTTAGSNSNFAFSPPFLSPLPLARRAYDVC